MEPMDKYHAKVKEYLLELEYSITNEDPNEGLFIVEKEEAGINNMLILCADPILIMEQHLFDIKKESLEVYKSLLQKNRDIIHGAFVLDETGKRVSFKDTLQIENLDLNELESSLNSLSLLLSEYTDEIIGFAHLK